MLFVVQDAASRLDMNYKRSFSKQIEYPSEAYKNNRRTLPYRLSELVFGSLLASFIIGFITFAPTIQISDGYTLLGLSQILQVLSISAIYTLYTSTMYMTYHQNILHIPAKKSNSSYDFMLAALLGFSYGATSFDPLLTFPLIPLSLFLAYWRARFVVRNFQTYLVDIFVTLANVKSPDLIDTNKNEFRTYLNTAFAKSKNPIVKSFNYKDTWFNGFSIAFVIFIAFLAVYIWYYSYLTDIIDPQNHIDVYFSAGVFIITSAILSRILIEQVSILPNFYDSSGAEEIDRALDHALHEALDQALPEGPGE
jgi:hypothetical protein